jgi:hypothetical protein
MKCRFRRAERRICSLLFPMTAVLPPAISCAADDPRRPPAIEAENVREWR